MPNSDWTYMGCPSLPDTELDAFYPDSQPTDPDYPMDTALFSRVMPNGKRQTIFSAQTLDGRWLVVLDPTRQR